MLVIVLTGVNRGRLLLQDLREQQFTVLTASTSGLSHSRQQKDRENISFIRSPTDPCSRFFSNMATRSDFMLACSPLKRKRLKRDANNRGAAFL
jgi:hypothetical protein